MYLFDFIFAKRPFHPLPADACASQEFFVIDAFLKTFNLALFGEKILAPKTAVGPPRILPGSAFTSSAFEDYCKKQNILHISITTGLLRSNGQIEKPNSVILSVLSKLSVDDPEKWYSHVLHLQEILNSTFQRSIKMTPFELLFGTKMKSCQDIEIVELLTMRLQLNSRTT
ncbi:transposon Ty3-I Gag-Pol polyprotein [Trichonephila clavipes]|nr:transposon Ty3-I Gag-Pol polyprotein [Trichonephila clavipes]